MGKKKWENQVKEWEENLKYSDPKKIEVRTLLREVDFRDKEVIDVGCGIGRLTVPISKVARKVIGIDEQKKVISYCKSKKNKPYLNQSNNNKYKNKVNEDLVQ